MTGITPEERLLGVIKKAQGKQRLKKELKIFTKINIILIGLIIVILAVFLVDIFTSDYKVSELSEASKEKETEILPVSDDFEVDIGEDIENFVEKRAFISKEEIEKNFNLMGIIAGDNTQVVIEDKRAKRTLFLYEGDSLGEFKVDDIKESSVILEYKGEKIELNM